MEKKTHCPHGHEYTDDNTYVNNGSKQCKTCRRKRMQERRPATGVGAGGINKAKTHCPKGHEYSQDNTIRSKNGKRRSCRECYLTKHRELNITKHGISTADKQRMVDCQFNRCLICGTEFSSDMRKCIDHDHLCCPGLYSCGRCIKGILCVDCNNGLGRFKDSVAVLRSAILYLEKWNN